MDQAATIAISTVLLGAIFGGTMRVITAWLERRREGRAAALVIYDALKEALEKLHEPHMHPIRPVLIAFDTYISVWDVERKALARTLSADDFAAISSAFGDLRAIRRCEEAGLDLREEVFGSLYAAGQLCEMGRRIAWRHAQSPRARAGRWRDSRREELKKRRSHREVERNIIELRRQRRLSCSA